MGQMHGREGLRIQVTVPGSRTANLLIEILESTEELYLGLSGVGMQLIAG